MAFDAPEDLEEFRTNVQNWLEENCPPSMRTPMKDDEIVWGGTREAFKNPDSKVWLERMGENGWTAPEWPAEYGGGGLNKAQARILQQELRRIKARPALFSFGLWMFGPALLEFGNDEQKKRFIPDIVKGKTRWCQGYSEPGAGSDLADLQTKCEDKGDHWLINGQKVWTSYADKSDWIFCLVRTDNSGSKHEGISFVLFDMDQPGVEARPIKLISGSSPFCETFFDNARAEKKNLIGEEGNGWTIAKYLLTHEREMISSFGAPPKKSVGQLAVESFGADASGRLANSILRPTIAQYQLDTLAFGATMARVGDEAKAGQGLGAASSIFKYYGTELNKRRNELNLAVGGEFALGWEGEAYRDGAISRDCLRSKGNSIEGGTSEVQLNIVAKRVLGLPDA